MSFRRWLLSQLLSRNFDSHNRETIKIYNCICKPERVWHWKRCFSEISSESLFDILRYIIRFAELCRSDSNGNWFTWRIRCEPNYEHHLLAREDHSSRWYHSVVQVVPSGETKNSAFHDENMSSFRGFPTALVRILKAMLSSLIVTKSFPARLRLFKSAFALIGPRLADSWQIKITDSRLCVPQRMIHVKDNHDAISGCLQKHRDGIWQINA